MVDYDHWLLWAHIERNGVNIGYPDRAPFYVEPHGWRETGHYYTDEDRRTADLVASGVRCLAGMDAKAAQVLVAWYGASIDAGENRGERLKPLGMSDSTIKRTRKGAEKWVAGYVEGRLQGSR